MARTRVLANFLGFLTDDPGADVERHELRVMLRADLADFKYQYYTLLYGGKVPSLVSLNSNLFKLQISNFEQVPAGDV
jgi:hypothetical protein